MTSGLFSLPFAPADAANLSMRAGQNGVGATLAETFIAGPENAVVRALSAAVTEEQLPYNPIVICGPPSIGKSSLIHALAARRQQKFPRSSAIVTTAVDLARSLAHAIETASADEFRTRHLRCDLLVVDDVHRLVGKPAAQQFLVTAIDVLRLRGTLILATLRQAPQATAGLVPALASRLAGGLVAQLAPPGALARRALVGQIIASKRLSLGEHQIAELARSSDAAPCPITTPGRLRRDVLRAAAAGEFASGNESSKSRPRDPAETKNVCRSVMAAVADLVGLTIGELKGKSRRQAVADARGLALYVARRLTAASYAELGRHFGGRDHTTVLHACRKIARAMDGDDTMRRTADDLIAQIASDGS